ncbi:MAG: GNAT family N-acetyltransferase [Bacteroidota bacterium]
MSYFDKIGVMGISSRLRMLSERMTKKSTEIYTLYEVDMQPKWFPVYFALAAGESKTITQIANEIGHTHPSVSKIVREMSKKGFVEAKKGKKDARKNVISLSAFAMKQKEKMIPQFNDVTQVIKEMLAQTAHNLWKAMEEWEYLLDQKDLLARVKTERKKQAQKEVQIVDYTPAHRQAFYVLNEEWISQYFVMEAADYKALDHPDEYILDKGGHIFMAFYQGDPVGTCSLVKMQSDDYDYELAKMAVTAKAKGLGIGYQLGKAVIEKARALGGRTLFLETNAILKPAINLYHKLGFRDIKHRPSVYARSNVQMVLDLALTQISAGPK